MPPGEPHVASARRLTLVSVFAAALWLFLVNPGTALAEGDHSRHEWDSPSDHGGGGWQDDSEGSPPSSGYPPDDGQPPSEGTGPEEPCEEEGPPEEHPPPVTPPEHTPPVPPETPPVPPETSPAPPVTTPPVETPPVETPVEAPVEETPTEETPSHENKPTPKPDVPESVTEHGGGLVLPLEQHQGGGGGVVTAAPTAGSLPFTGSEIPVVVALGIALLGVGLVLHRVSAARG
jgi:hypothetical protein